MRRKKKRRKLENVQLNLAAMLDMAFQLLTFFILTFRPAPTEGYLQLNLPPPVALTNVRADAPPSDSPAGELGLETLNLFVTSNDQGEVTEITVGMQPVIKGGLSPVTLRRLHEHLKSIFDIQAIPFDRIQLAVDGRLRYEELMKIVDVCTKQVLPSGQHLQRVSFIELGNQGK